MSTETVIWVAVVIAAIVAILTVGLVVLQHQRRHRLRERFGPEYERTVNERGTRRDAEQELRAREERVAKLDIRPLAPQARKDYARRWVEVQERFVDAPGYAVTEADQLVTAVMTDRGYPTGEKFEQRVSDLSVTHGRTLDRYRQAHDISGRAARENSSTEELRQAMVHYRALFEELLGEGGDPVTTAREGRNGTAAGDHGTTIPEQPGEPRHAHARPGAAAPETTREPTAERNLRGR
ncbi:hypothetical protein [Streptosporangium sp. KLBMP 9127]|nr:hypothetical protein [Streptosporangium sp. KLBMP 9127]